jgi:hypothetical protein
MSLKKFNKMKNQSADLKFSCNKMKIYINVMKAYDDNPP